MRGVDSGPDGKVLANGCCGGAARLWHTTTGKLLTRVRHQGAVFSLAFSPDGKLLAAGSFDATARLWDVATGQAYGWPMRHQGIVKQVAFSPDGKHLATGSADGTARLWKVSRTEEMVLKAQDRVWAVAFHPGGNFLAAGSEDGLAHIWDTRIGKQIGQALEQPRDSSGQLCKVLGLAFNPNGESL